MSEFTQNVNISPVPQSSKRVTTSEIVWYLDYWQKKRPIVIPEWYVFDWASTPTNIFASLCFLSVFVTPRLFPLAVIWYYMQRTEPNTISAATLHDYIYTDRPHGLTLAQADNIFLEALIACNTNKVKALMMRLWVRIWGRWYWYRIPKKVKSLFKKDTKWD